jgi:hypothetical protein
MRNMTMAAILATALVALAAACGGSSSSSDSTTTEAASDWANNICGSMSTWVTAVQNSMDPVSKGDISKDSLTSAGDDLKSATTTFVDDVKSLGPPDTASGQKAKDEIDTLADELSTDADTIKSALNDISSGSGIAAAVSTITTTAQKMGTQAQTAVNNLKGLDAKGELKSAFENAPNCKTLNKSS